MMKDGKDVSKRKDNYSNTGKKVKKAINRDMNQRQILKPGNMLYPLPVVMVSCGRPGEKPNIITIAWTGTVCSDPPMLSI